jgi:hypothetical protein
MTTLSLAALSNLDHIEILMRRWIRLLGGYCLEPLIRLQVQNKPNSTFYARLRRMALIGILTVKIDICLEDLHEPTCASTLKSMATRLFIFFVSVASE